MIVTGHQIGVWAVGIIGTVIANIITFLLFTAVTGTGWFKALLIKITKLFNDIDPMTGKPKIKE